MAERQTGTIVKFRAFGRDVSFFVANPNDAIQSHHLAGSFYESEELSIISKFYQGGAFLDLGANVGNHTIFAASILRSPCVIPFEVSPEALRILKINILLNNCSNVNDVYLGFGAASEDCHLVLTSHDRNNLGGDRFVKVPASDSGQLIFRAVRLDNII